jgi:sugar phosphate isomerase/epimerase
MQLDNGHKKATFVFIHPTFGIKTTCQMNMKTIFMVLALMLGSQCVSAQTAVIGGKKIAIGLEIYSLRAMLAKDVPGTLAKMKAMGFRELEVSGYYGMTPENFKKEMAKNGLICTSMLFGYDRFQKDVAGIVREAKLFKCKNVGCAWIKGEGPVDAAQIEKAANIFNAAGEQTKKAGIRVFYHTHGYEFAPAPGGGTLFDLMVAKAKPGIFDFQLDVFWAFHAGVDPAALLEKYPKRFISLHLKDMKKGEKTGFFTGGADVETNVALGAGQLDFAKIMASAVKTGVKGFYIEDESSIAAEQIPLTLDFLAKLK